MYSQKEINDWIPNKFYSEAVHRAFLSVISQALQTFVECEAEQERLVQKDGHPDKAEEYRQVQRNTHVHVCTATKVSHSRWIKYKAFQDNSDIRSVDKGVPSSLSITFMLTAANVINVTENDVPIKMSIHRLVLYIA